MHPFRNFKGFIFSCYFPRLEFFLFASLILIVFFIFNINYIQIAHIGTLKQKNSQPSSMVLSINNREAQTIDLLSNNGNVNPLIWGVNAADKHLLWANNKALEQRLSSAKMRIVRVGPIQYANYALGHNMCTAPASCNFSAMDASLKTITDSGAEALFIVVAYPGGFAQYDWQSYAIFMKQVVTRYNVKLVLGKKIRYWEMWNEPTDEPDGKIPTKQLYGAFIKVVGSAMKSVDPTIKLIAPAAPYADFSSNGWLSYVAHNTNNLIDILSWHDYGSNNMNDQMRLTYTNSKYYDNIQMVAGSNNFVNAAGGKRYGAAITEYNMAAQPLTDRRTAQFHNNYNAVYVASAIINAMQAKVQLLTFFTLAQSGTNLLGILNPTNNSYTPFKPYYTFYLFGNHMGKILLKGTSDSGLLEYVASKSADGNTVFIIAVNKNLNDVQHLNVKISNVNSGNYRVYELDARTNPLAGLNRSYQSGQFTYTLPPLSITAFEISLSQRTNRASPLPMVNISISLNFLLLRYIPFALMMVFCNKGVQGSECDLAELASFSGYQLHHNVLILFIPQMSHIYDFASINQVYLTSEKFHYF